METHKHKKVRIMERRSGGLMDEIFWFLIIQRKEAAEIEITLKPTMEWEIGSFFDKR